MTVSEKEFDAEGDHHECDEGVGVDGRDELVDEGADGGAEEHVGDDDHDDIEVHCRGVLGGVPAEDQADEVEERGPYRQGVREGGGL